MVVVMVIVLLEMRMMRMLMLIMVVMMMMMMMMICGGSYGVVRRGGRWLLAGQTSLHTHYFPQLRHFQLIICLWDWLLLKISDAVKPLNTLIIFQSFHSLLIIFHSSDIFSPKISQAADYLFMSRDWKISNSIENLPNIALIYNQHFTNLGT